MLSNCIYMDSCSLIFEVSPFYLSSSCDYLFKVNSDRKEYILPMIWGFSNLQAVLYVILVIIHTIMLKVIAPCYLKVKYAILDKCVLRSKV